VSKAGRRTLTSAPTYLTTEKLETRKVIGLNHVRECTLGADLVLLGFFPEHAIETVIKCAVDLEERVEVAVTELATVISDVVCDHQEEFERKLGARHRM
jgi:hypothetical protein